MNPSRHSYSCGHRHGLALSLPKGFSLIELLISLGIIATLTGMSIAVLNPAEMLRKGRDTQRIQELNSLKDAILLYQGEYSSTPLAPSTTTVYLSLPDTNANCSSYSLPSLPGGYSYACKPASTLRKTDGTGWIPINLTNLSQTIGSTPLSTLPKDPVNNTPTNYYTFTVNGSNQFELNASLEAQTNTTLMVSDVGDNDLSYETGTLLTIYPIAGYQLAKTDSDNQPIYSQSDLLYAAGTSPYLPYFTDGTHLGNTGIYWNNATSKLGIGTASPGSTLSIAGNLEFSADDPLIILSDTGLGGTIWKIKNGTSGNGKLTFTDNDTARVTFTNDGNVGIGTTGPTYPLHVIGNIFSSATLYASGGNASLTQNGIYASPGTGNRLNITNQSNGGISFSPNSTEQIRISAAGGLSLGNSYVGTDAGAGNMIISGNVGIGTTSPSQKLDVAGTVKATAFQGDGSALTGIQGVPSTAVMFFNAAACPSGWTALSAADGRVIVGISTTTGKTLAGTVGTALTNLEDRTHVHTTATGGAHTHTNYTGGAESATPTGTYSVGSGGSSHSHGNTGTAATSNVVPYIQLLVCQKD